MILSRSKLLTLVMAVLVFTHTLSFASEEGDVPQVRLAIEKMKKITSTESRGDELYFSITEYSSIERPRTYLVPNFPTHWLSDHLSEINQVVLWQKPIQQNESVMLVISLIERDAPPWNVDDLIGTIKLKLKLENGALVKEWQIPNQKEVQLADKDQQLFVMTGDNGNYELDLKVMDP